MRARIGPFQLQRPLGHAGMSRVFEATVTEEDVTRRVAVKVLTSESAQEPERTAAFLREVELLERLRHHHVVSLVSDGLLTAEEANATDGELSEGAPWFATELARGGNLSSLRGRVAWPRARRLIRQLLAVLEHLHTRDVLHLDIKPDNLLLAGPDHLRICDFGLALDGARAEQRLSEWGTPAYMAPEQLVDPPGTPTARTDLYSAGCVAWALLTGRPPFGRAPEEASVQHVYGALPAFRSPHPVPPGTQGWLRGLLARNPDERFASAKEARRALLTLEEPHRGRWFIFPSAAPKAEPVTTLRLVQS